MRSVRTFAMTALCVLALPWAAAQAGGIVIGVGIPGAYYRPYYRPYYYGPRVYVAPPPAVYITPVPVYVAPPPPVYVQPAPTVIPSPTPQTVPAPLPTR